MRVAEAVGRGLAGLGVDTVFGVVGSGNFHITNALVAGGARFVAARHEGGAAVMADAWARTTGSPGVVTVHQGPGLTNAMTGIAEAAKSRTPLLVLPADAHQIRSNFHVDVAGLAAAVGAVPERLYSPASALADAHRAYATALGRRTVILALPLSVQGSACEPGLVPALRRAYPTAPAAESGNLALVPRSVQGQDPALVDQLRRRAQGSGPLAVEDMQAHQMAIVGFMQRVVMQQPLSVGDGSLELGGAHALIPDQRSHRGGREHAARPCSITLEKAA